MIYYMINILLALYFILLYFYCISIQLDWYAAGLMIFRLYGLWKLRLKSG